MLELCPNDSFCLGCENRFTHANRHCNEHPAVGVRRDKVTTAQVGPSPPNAANTVVSSRRPKKQPVNGDDVENSRSRVSSKKRLAGAVRLRARKLKQELDAADDSCSKSSVQSTPNEVPESDLIINEDDYIPKKKRAALQLKANSGSETMFTVIPQTLTHPVVDTKPIFESDAIVVNNQISPQDAAIMSDDKLMGALALIELAGGSTSDIVIKSEVVMSSSPSQDASILLAALGKSANHDHVYY